MSVFKLFKHCCAFFLVILTAITGIHSFRFRNHLPRESLDTAYFIYNSTYGGTESWNISQSCAVPDHSKVLRLLFSHLCLNIYYERADCTGKFIRLDPQSTTVESIFSNLRAGKNQIDSPVIASMQDIKSVSSCLDKCDALNWDNLTLDEPVALKLFAQSEFKGNSVDLTVKGKSCTQIPRDQIPSVHSIQFLGNSTVSCIELHSSAKCDDTVYAILRPNFPSLGSLAMQGMHTRAELSATNAQAISLCGNFCKKQACDTEEEENEEIEETETKEKVLMEELDELMHPEEGLSFTESTFRLFYEDRTIGNLTISPEPSFCVPLPSKDLRGVGYTSQSREGCVQLYEGSGCGKGPFIRWQPQQHHAYMQIQSDLDLGFRAGPIFKAVGSCNEFCNSKNWSKEKPKKVQFTVFVDSSGLLRFENITVKPDQCHKLKPNIKAQSFSIEGTKEPCIFIYRDKHCLGTEGISLLKASEGMPLYQSNFEEEIRNARSVSLCQTFCLKGKMEEPVVENSKLSAGVVQVFGEAGFQGKGIHVNLTTGCANLKHEELSERFSINTNNHCVIMFSTWNCEMKYPSTRTLQTRGRNLNYYKDKILSMRMPLRIRSLRFCLPQEIEEKTSKERTTGHGFLKHSAIFLAIICQVIAISLITIVVYKKYLKLQSKNEDEGEEISILQVRYQASSPTQTM